MKMATPMLTQEVLPSTSMLFFSFRIKINTIIWLFSNGTWLSKSQESCDIDAKVFEHVVSVEETTPLFHRVTEHRCASAFWSCSLMPKSHCAIFTGVGWHLERWAACVVPALVGPHLYRGEGVCSIFAKGKGNFTRPYLMKDCFPHFTAELYFQFLPQKGNVWPRLRIYQAWNQLRDVMSPFGVRSGPKPQRNQHLVSFLLPQRTLLT